MNYRRETTVQDVLAMYMHIYWQGLYYVQSILKKRESVIVWYWEYLVGCPAQCFKMLILVGKKTSDLLRWFISCLSAHRKHYRDIRHQPNYYPGKSSINARTSTFSYPVPLSAQPGDLCCTYYLFQGNSIDLHKIILKWTN